MKKFIALIMILISCFLLSVDGQAAEIVRQKNAATYVVFPIVKNDGTLISSAAGLDSEIDTFADGTAPNGFADLTNEATEIGSTGQYYLSLTQAEMNVDYAAIQVKSTTTDAMVQTLLIRTTVGDPLNVATTDDGGAINVTSGKVDEVAALTGHTAQTGDVYARLGAPVGASVSADIAAVKSDSGAILTDTAALDTSGELRTLLFGSDTAGATAANQTTILGYIDTEVAAILEDTGTTIPAAIPAASAIADAVWDEAISGHLGAGTTGNALNAAGSAGDPWSTPLPGAYGAGTAGYIIGTNINAPIGTVDTVVDAIKAKTDSLTFTGAGIVDANVVNWKGSAAAAMTGDAYARLGAPAGASVSADIAAVKSDSAAILVDTGTTLDGKMDTIAGYVDTEVAAILTDTNELQTDWANGGRLDLILDSAVNTTTVY